jgi:hypothetical protein
MLFYYGPWTHGSVVVGVFEGLDDGWAEGSFDEGFDDGDCNGSDDGVRRLFWTAFSRARTMVGVVSHPTSL